MPHRLAARLLAACCASAIVALAASPAAASASHSDAHDAPNVTSLSLLAQNPWVTGSAGVRLRLAVSSPLGAAALGVKVILYSEVRTRDAFAQTLGGSEPSSEVPLESLPEGRTIPLSGLDDNGVVNLHLPVVAGEATAAGTLRSPTLSLDCTGATSYCPGVYPLELVLFDTASGTQLASLTTYLVYAPPQTGALRLQVGLVLPLGNEPALAPGGASDITDARLSSLSELANALSTLPPGVLTVDAHAQLLAALARTPGADARAVVAGLDRALGSAAPAQEPLLAPFAAVSASELADRGLGPDLAAQLGVARRTESAMLRARPGVNPWVASQPLGPAGARLLASLGVRDLVVPAASLALPPSTTAGTIVAPFRLDPSSGDPGAMAFAADAELALPFEAPTDDPVLAAEQFLAELSVVYFEAPFSSTKRAIVVTPTSAGSGSAFLSAVLSGLEDSPLVQPVTLSTLFGAWAGAKDLTTTDLVPARSAGGPDRQTLDGARRELAVLHSVIPASPKETTELAESLLLGETSGLSLRAWRAYERAPARALTAVSQKLSLAGDHTVTLTSLNGRVPVTIASLVGSTVDVVLHVSGSGLHFPAGTRFPLQISTRDHSIEIAVSSLTSGLTTLDVTLLAPDGNFVLASERVTIRETAISGVAIGLSVGALVVLAIWWWRSVRRSRRRRANARSAAAADDAARETVGETA